MIYYIYFHKTGHVKIGTTEDIRGRIANLKHYGLDNAVIVGIHDGDVVEETEVHQIFDYLRLPGKGELFQIDDALIEYIELQHCPNYFANYKWFVAFRCDSIMFGRLWREYMQIEQPALKTYLSTAVIDI